MITNDKPRTRKGWSEAVAAILKLGKAIPQDRIDDLADVIDFDASVADGINANYVNRVPGRAEIPVSPVTAASGGGAESLIEWSSDLSPQEGITRLYDAFSKLLKRFDEMAKGQIQLAANVAEFVKSNARFPDGEEEVADEDEDSDEKQIEKALAGAGIRTGAIRDVLNAVRSYNDLKMPPSFVKAAISKADAAGYADELTFEQDVRLQEARQLLQAHANGVNIHHERVSQAMRVLENPAGDVV